MPEITYDAIAPLIEQQDVSGHSVTVTFRCPVSGRQIRSGAQVVEDQAGKVGKAVKQSLWRNLRWSLGRMVRSVFGYGVAGEIGSTVAYTAMSSADAREYEPSKEQVKQATLEAFRNAQSQFAWDASTNRWVAASVFKELQTEFAITIQATVFDKPWDRNILARMLTEVAAADGTIEEQEREFFHAFTGGNGPSLDELLEKPALTKAELGETSAEVRKAMLLLAMAVAMSDEEFAESERAKLAHFAAGFGLGQGDVDRAALLAADYVVDQALETAYADGKVDAAERHHVDQLSFRLGVDTDRLERLDARCRKRKGLL
ncbi:MAG: TerB family tellurite resistance protein [Deltaproteobacteria bacterium]|nr:MAG: TerB family tellurite resistance protein [Deltaproteobacteria bacterium]